MTNSSIPGLEFINTNHSTSPFIKEFKHPGEVLLSQVEEKAKTQQAHHVLSHKPHTSNSTSGP